MNGVRILCSEDSFDWDGNIRTYSNPDEYDLIRNLLGIPEGSREVGGHFPLHLNFQQLNGVSTRKGCYVG